MHDYLSAILNQKVDEVKQLKLKVKTNHGDKVAQIFHQGYVDRSLKSLKQALSAEGVGVIAEIKRRSPSKAALADIPEPAILAQRYVKGGCAAISVLTDYYGFAGSLADLTAVSAALANTAIPILRKDFIIDPIQIAESIAYGADAILLIVSILQDRTQDMLQLAHNFGIEALVEVHDQAELNYALRIGADLIGVNNRNLTTFDVDINNAKQLITTIPDTVVSVAESGIDSLDVALEYQRLGYNGLLIGEALVKSSSPETFIQQLKVSASDPCES